MATRRQRKEAAGMQASAGEETAAPALTSISGGVKRKKAAPQKQQTPAAEEAPETKQNRRATKKAKVESEAAAVVAAAQREQADSLRSKASKARSAKKVVKQQVKDEEERELEAFLFGGTETQPVEDEEESEDEQTATHTASAGDDDEAPLFQIDTTGGLKQEAPVESKKAAAVAAPTGPAPAWVDEDDANESQLVDLSSAARLRKLKTGAEERYVTGAEYSRRLRQVYQELHPGAAEWAQVPADATDADITQLLLQSTSSVTTANGAGANGKLPGGAGRGEKLPQGTLEVVRMKDANLVSPNQSVTTSCKFHEAGQLMLTAGLDKMVRLFQIDGIENAKVQGVWLEDMPVMSAEWLRDSVAQQQSAEIVASGRRSYFYTIDVQTNAVTKVPNIKGREERSLEVMTVSPDGQYIAFLGNDGYILLVSGRTKQYVGALKQNMSVRSVSFSADSSMLFSIGGEGLLYIWDIATRKCMYKAQDEGNISGTAVAQDIGGKGYYAIGSSSGVVNLYNSQQLSDRLASSASAASSAASSRFASLSHPSPSPLKSFMNLTTPIDSILFNCDAQLMLISSRRKKDALKLVHVESQTVFQNWPTSSTPLHNVSCVDFSPNSGYMAIGNDRGRVLLYRLTHYPRA